MTAGGPSEHRTLGTAATSWHVRTKPRPCYCFSSPRVIQAALKQRQSLKMPMAVACKHVDGALDAAALTGTFDV